jgi:hypothetical protein
MMGIFNVASQPLKPMLDGPTQGQGQSTSPCMLLKNKQGKVMWPKVRESLYLDLSDSLDSLDGLAALLRGAAEEETPAERYHAQCKRNNIAPLISVSKLLARCAARCSSTRPVYIFCPQCRPWAQLRAWCTTAQAS